MSFLTDTNRFWREIDDLNVSNDEKRKLFAQFIRHYKRSNDYDLASSKVFDELMRVSSRKSAFKSQWSSFSKHAIGDVVIFNNKKYQIESMKPVSSTEKEYILSRLGLADDGVSLKVLMLKVRAADTDLLSV